MGATLKIDSEEAVRLATELAGLHGESLEAAVMRSLHGALEREGRRPAEARAADSSESDWAEREYQALRAIADDIHRHLDYALPVSDHSWLYDDVGLPR